jgi:transposase
MKFDFFIGIDVSKNELDFSVVKSTTELFHMETANSLDGIRTFIKKLKSQQGFDLAKCVFCMEHTGIYNNHLLEYLTKKKAAICQESPIHIKKSSGLQRGKNDKVDALRIALYAYKNREELRFWEPKREAVQRLKYLITVRSRTINALKQLRTPLKEEHDFVNSRIRNSAGKLNNASIKSLEKELKDIEKEIALIIKSDKELKRLFDLAVSVDGIGMVTATNIIIATNEFKDITEAKKFACYAGVAPFEHSSGSSVRGKTRVSRMANKTIKSLLHMAALSCIARKGELRDYFERKVKEGKNKMSVINAIRNKLVLRIFACVKQNRKYENIYINALA